APPWESTTATTAGGGDRRPPRAAWPQCGSPECPSARIKSLRGRDTESRPLGGQLHAVAELDTGERVLGEEQIAVEVDVGHEARDVRAGGDAETRLDHAPEHHPEGERRRRVDP